MRRAALPVAAAHVVPLFERSLFAIIDVAAIVLCELIDKKRS